MKKVANLIKIYILRILGVLFLFFLLLAIISIFVKLDKEALSTSEAPTDVSMLNYDENWKYVKIEIEDIFNPVVLDNDSDYESLVYKWESGEDITFEVDNLNGEYEIDRSSLIKSIQDDDAQFKIVCGDAGSGKSAICKKILMEEERARKWKEEWWNKHYILRFFHNLPPRNVVTNR